MAAENLKSTEVTNADATPVVYNDTQNVQGKVYHAVGVVEAAGGDAGSTYKFVRLPADAIVKRVEFACDDTGDGTINLGLYDVTDAAVEDADFFASALATGTAIARTDVSYESAVRAIDDAGLQLWEELSLTDNATNRGKEFDVYGTSVTNAATGTMAVWVEYVREA